MGRYLMYRILKGLLTLLVSVTITFFILRLMPADPVSILIDPKMGPEVQQAMMKRFGLDKPIWEQYIIFLKGLIKGDLGLSFKNQRPVMEVIMEKLPWTLLLLFIVNIMLLIIGVPIGVLAAIKRGQLIDKVINISVVIGISIFVPFLAFSFLYIFAYYLKLLPTGGAYTPPPGDGLAYYMDVAKHAILPSLTLLFANIASVVLYTRNSMIDILKEDYIRTAYAKGLKNNYIIQIHALKNAMIPTVTVIGLMIGSMVGGAVMTETIFSWPGIGRLIYDSVAAMDYPVLQGAFLILAISVILMNIITDLIIAWLDPRIKIGG
ncbi:MAG: ABC transporter permease [Thermoanaerobacter sp.]|nr:ABC transporter permease [Thermoanaerobacter sp.]